MRLPITRHISLVGIHYKKLLCCLLHTRSIISGRDPTIKTSRQQPTSKDRIMWVQCPSPFRTLTLFATTNKHLSWLHRSRSLHHKIALCECTALLPFVYMPDPSPAVFSVPPFCRNYRTSLCLEAMHAMSRVIAHSYHTLTSPTTWGTSCVLSSLWAPSIACIAVSWVHRPSSTSMSLPSSKTTTCLITATPCRWEHPHTVHVASSSYPCLVSCCAALEEAPKQHSTARIDTWL